MYRKLPLRVLGEETGGITQWVCPPQKAMGK